MDHNNDNTYILNAINDIDTHKFANSTRFHTCTHSQLHKHIHSVPTQGNTYIYKLIYMYVLTTKEKLNNFPHTQIKVQWAGEQKILITMVMMMLTSKQKLKKWNNKIKNFIDTKNMRWYGSWHKYPQVYTHTHIAHNLTMA